jgi:hypothetical protein
MKKEVHTIVPGVTFILRSKYFEGRFIIFEENRDWFGHINAFAAQDEFSKILLGCKLNSFVVVDFGLGVIDAYQITQIRQGPFFYRELTFTVGSETEYISHRDRTIDGAREKWAFNEPAPETTLSKLYAEIKKNPKKIALRDLRITKVEITSDQKLGESKIVEPTENVSNTSQQAEYDAISERYEQERAARQASKTPEQIAYEKSVTQILDITFSLNSAITEQDKSACQSIVQRASEAIDSAPASLCESSICLNLKALIEQAQELGKKTD